MASENKYKLWASWMEKAQTGDKEAYKMLLVDISPYIKKLLYSKMSGSQNIDDVTQDVLMTVHRARHTFDASRPFKPWLNAVIQSRMMDHWRKHKRIEQNEAPVEDIEGSSSITPPPQIDRLNLRDLERALDQLSDSQKNVVTLLKIEGHSVKEIASKLDMTESAVKVTAHRGYKKLIEVLDEK